ncbi:hypothetical protein PoB_004173500 [Plakobranchus ocellatus]|uniref:SCP domain-containing protein n=1 Tax=Plakobranchus ocellatus TaxID=259542 RepID=A0AAV4B6R2_9GAST|nr:hypothetical protein PoB_004173500 [Plakobranchus ocellatus]
MHGQSVPVWTTLAIACMLSVRVCWAQRLSAADRKAALDLHNYYRHKEVTTRSATNMRLMEWDLKLENFANTYLKRCQNRHSPVSLHVGIGLTPTEQIGENLFATRNSGVGQHLQGRVCSKEMPKGGHRNVQLRSNSRGRRRRRGEEDKKENEEDDVEDEDMEEEEKKEEKEEKEEAEEEKVIEGKEKDEEEQDKMRW